MWKAVFDWDDEGWRDQAACRRCDAELFFPLGTTGGAVDQIRAAKSVCRSCAVRGACLHFALTTNQEAGIWGGSDGRAPEAAPGVAAQPWAPKRSAMT